MSAAVPSQRQLRACVQIAVHTFAAATAAQWLVGGRPACMSLPVGLLHAGKWAAFGVWCCDVALSRARMTLPGLFCVKLLSE